MHGLLTAAMAWVGAGQLQAEQQETTTWSRRVTQEEHLDVKVEYGAGKLVIGRSAPGVLYRATFEYDRTGATPLHRYDDGRLDVGLDAAERRGFDGGQHAQASLDLRLSDEVPMDLRFDFGAAEADVDLSGIPLRSLELNTGASRSDIRVDAVNRERMTSATFSVGAAEFEASGLGNLNADRVTVNAGVGSVMLGLDGEWPRDGVVSVEMGLGALTVRVPAALGVHIERNNNVLAPMSADGFVRDGRDYRSRNWETADRKVRLEISAAVAKIDIVRTP